MHVYIRHFSDNCHQQLCSLVVSGFIVYLFFAEALFASPYLCVHACMCACWCVKEWEKERGDREWAVCHAWEGAKACLNCLLASKPLICKLASLVLPFLSFLFLSCPPPSLPLSLHLFCAWASLLSTPVSFCHFSTVVHLWEQERHLSSRTFTRSHANTQMMANRTAHVAL